MTFRATIARADLLRVLAATTKAVETRNTYPILANVLLSGEGDGLTVRGSDMDIEITSRCQAVGAEGEITAHGKTLLDIVRKLPEGDVVLATDAENLTIKSGRSRYKLATLPVDSFPSLKPGKYVAEFDADLSSVFGRVAFAISNEETRYYLNGVYMHPADGKLRAVATDGHRLARNDGPEIDADFTGVIVPKKTVALLPDGPLHVEVGDRMIRFTAGETVILSKLIEGTFPDYERVTPKNNDNVVGVDRSDFTKALDRVAIVSSDRGGKAVRLTFSDDNVDLSCRNGDGDEASEGVPVDAVIDLSIGFNAGYLSEIVKAAGGTDVRLAFNDANSPALVKSPDNDNWLGVLMPMRVA